MFSEISYLGGLWLLGVFSLTVLTCLLMKLKVTQTSDTNLPRNHFVKTIKKASGQWISFARRIMYSEKGPKNRGTWRKTQQPSFRLFPSTRGGESFIEMVELNPLLLQQLIQVLHKTDNCKKMGFKNLWRLQNNLLFFSCKSQ